MAATFLDVIFNDIAALKLFYMSDNYNNAVNQLRNAKTVNQWNKIRENVKKSLTRDELAKIDSGLIVEVLGKD